MSDNPWVGGGLSRPVRDADGDQVVHGPGANRMAPSPALLRAKAVIIGVLRCSDADDAAMTAVLENMVSEAVAEDRRRWVMHLDAALAEVQDAAGSGVNVAWRARIRALVGARIAAAVAAEREACALLALHTAKRGAAAIRARGGA
mgnify:CR=1 FL=1